MIPPDQQLTDDEWAELLDREEARRESCEPQRIASEKEEWHYEVDKNDRKLP